MRRAPANLRRSTLQCPGYSGAHGIHVFHGQTGMHGQRHQFGVQLFGNGQAFAMAEVTQKVIGLVMDASGQAKEKFMDASGQAKEKLIDASGQAKEKLIEASSQAKDKLMEKGTQVVGEYRGGLQRGQKRLFVLWNRAKTPKGVIVTLASPATDALGRAGVDGYVDTHWWERFGSALLLSIVGDATSYANSRLQDSDVDAQNTTSAGQQAAAIAVEQSITIPPTLNQHQGELVSIFVARDLDFSGIYRLRVTEPKNRILDRAALGDFAPDSKLVTK